MLSKVLTHLTDIATGQVTGGRLIRSLTHVFSSHELQAGLPATVAELLTFVSISQLHKTGVHM